MSSVRSDTQSLPALQDMLCFAVYSAGHAFNRFYKALLDESGLTYPQYLVMTALWSQDNRTVGELGQQLQLESNTLTPLLKRLEAAGNISRRRDSQDERAVRIKLTRSGAALREKLRDVPRCVLSATGLTPAQLRRLVSDMDALRDRLQDVA